MSTRVKKDFEFLAGIYFQEKLLVNSYGISIYMDILTESMMDQQIAIERVKYFIENCFNDCVFINQSEKKAIEKFNGLNIRTCTLPDDPYDQIIAIGTICKLNAILENRFECTHINLKSRLSDGVEFLFDIEESFGPFEEQNRWWNDHGLAITDVVSTNKKDKVVKLNKQNNLDWASNGLVWHHPEHKETSEVVLFIDTDK